MNGLLKAEWQEILGCTPSHLGADGGVEDISVLGASPRPLDQKEGLKVLLGTEQKAILPMPDLSKAVPLQVAANDEETGTQGEYLQRIALGLPLFDAKKNAATPPEPVLDKTALHKHFGDSPKKLFRAFFQEQKSLGKSVSEILARFTDEAKFAYAEELVELSQEFA
jgi:hypothetical protein